jgi:hypothetical protein
MSTKVKWGLITGAVYVIFTLINNLLGLMDGGGFTLTALLSNAALFAATFFTVFSGIKETKEQKLDGFITFGQGFRSGMGIVLIAALIVFAFTLIYIYLIDPGMIDKVMEMTEESWEKQGMPEEQRDAARKYTGMFMTPWAFSLIAIVSCIFWGLVKSLIASAILKNEAPPTVPMA